MSGFELNKLIAAILLSCLIAMLAGTLVNILYKPSHKAIARGYEIEVTESDDATESGDAKEEEPDIPALMAAANADAGKSLVKKCLSCHTLDAGGQNKIGPNLHNIYNAKKGAKEGFSYSKALLAKGGIWDDASLFHFIKKPKAYIQGTKMSFVGIKKYEDIANIIAFLKQLTN